MKGEGRRQYVFAWLGPVDTTLFLAVVSLMGVGLVAVYSATVRSAAFSAGNPAAWFQRQLVWTVLGFGVMCLVSRVPYTWWRRVAVPLLIGTVLALFWVAAVGQTVFGSRRFLLGNSVQPAEVAKFALVVYAASWLASRIDRLRDISYGLIPFSVLVGGIAGLVAIQPDLSTAFFLGVIGFTLFFVAGAEYRQLAIVVVLGTLTVLLLVLISAYAQARVREFLSIWRGDYASGWSQLQVAVYLVHEGGLLGRGPGAISIALPAIHNDFIYAAIGHAFGLWGMAFVVGLVVLVLWRGLVIAAHAPDMFGHFLAVGMTTWLVGQALINMAVSVALLPPTGMTLPFVSYGGSSMVSASAAAGVLLQLSQYVPTKVKRDAADDVRRGDRRSRVPPAKRVGSPAGD